METKKELIDLIDRLHSDEVTQQDNDDWFVLISRFEHDWVYLDEIAHYHNAKNVDKVEELAPVVVTKMQEHKKKLFSNIQTKKSTEE